MGRPTKYKPEYCEHIIEYFDRVPYTELVTIKGRQLVPCDPPNLYGFAASIKVCHDTLHEWGSKYPDFFAAIKKAKALQANIIIINGANGAYAQAFAIFMAKNIMKWRDNKGLATEIVDELKKEDMLIK